MDDKILPLLTRIAEALERAAPPPPATVDLAAADGFVWHPERHTLRPVGKGLCCKLLSRPHEDVDWPVVWTVRPF